MIKEVELGSVCHFENGDRGKNYPSQSAFIDRGIPFISAKNLEGYEINSENLKFISEESYNKLGSGKLQPNDILFCLRGSLGKFAINNNSIKGAIASSLVLLRAKEDLNINYLKHYLKSPRLQRLVTKSDNGSSQPNLSGSNVKKFLIPLPPLDQQKKIAAILDTADAYRQKTKALIDRYDALTQSLFLDMFGDPVANTKGWQVNKLKDLSSKIHSGNTPKGGSKVYVNEGITFFRSQNVWKNRIVYEDVAYIDDATHNNMLNSSVKHKDILMTKTGRINTENSSLGRAAMYLGEDDKANVNGHVYLIRLKEGVINEFVLHILTTKEYRGHIRRVCVGGIDKRQLNKGHIEDFPIIYPPREMQEKFISSLLLMQDHKDKLKESLVQANNLFNSLLQKAFKGELTN